MTCKDVFKMPTPVTIMGRTSSITNSFVNGIIPCIYPTEEEIERVLSILGMDKDTIRCAYCGDKYTEWDHFKPLVKNKMPTGYISEICNLVPACGKCNQSKGNKDWKEWIISDAALSPKIRKVKDLSLIIERLNEFEKTAAPTKLDFEKIVGKELWQSHWQNCEDLNKAMKSSQEISNRIREILKTSINKEITSAFKTAIEEVSIDPDPYKDIGHISKKQVGVIAQTNLKEMLESNTVSEYVIERLQRLDYCKNMFDINFPVLKKVQHDIDISIQRKDHYQRDRYYALPLIIAGEKYLLTSQWYERNKNKLIQFIEATQHQCY